MLYVILREFITRIRKRSFILMSILGPFAFSLIAILPSYLSKHSGEKGKNFGLVDNYGGFIEKLDNNNYNLIPIKKPNKDSLVQLLDSEKYLGLLYISTNADTINYISHFQPSISFLNYIEKTIENTLVEKELDKYGIKNISFTINTIRQKTKVEVIKDAETNQSANNPRLKSSVSLLLGTLIYLYVFLFSAQVMRGVLEEKSNRVIELIITSISPVRFIAGKIIGIALVGITQLSIWVAISYVIINLFVGNMDINNPSITQSFMGRQISPEIIDLLTNNLEQFQFHIIIPAFFFFFLSGYLLYSAIFSAIGAIVNHNDETQQLSTVISIPLIAAIIVLSSTMNNPDSDLSYWFSMIPFTSPVVMMGRIIHGVPVGQMIMSALILILTIIGITWLSGKIYHIAILQVGKKHHLKDIISWIKIKR